MPDVALRPIDDATLEELLRVAVDDAEPDEVMPPIDGEPGWTEQRRQAFRTFHHARRSGLDGPLRELGLAIVADDEMAGVARMRRRDGGLFEIGLWIGRSHRGRVVLSSVIERSGRAPFQLSRKFPPRCPVETIPAQMRAAGSFGSVSRAGSGSPRHRRRKLSRS